MVTKETSVPLTPPRHVTWLTLPGMRDDGSYVVIGTVFIKPFTARQASTVSFTMV
jgi:hypothetical protein